MEARIDISELKRKGRPFGMTSSGQESYADLLDGVASGNGTGYGAKRFLATPSYVERAQHLPARIRKQVFPETGSPDNRVPVSIPMRASYPMAGIVLL